INDSVRVSHNCIALTGQMAGPNPTVGIGVSVTAGPQAPLLQTNGISGAFYGCLLYSNNAAVPTLIKGDAITGVMQGVAVLNINPQTLTTFGPSSFDVDSVSVSAFAGNHPGNPNNNIHAGVYVFTGGSVAANKITGTITNVSVTGTGKIGPDSSGLDFADFSTASGVMQQIAVQDC